MKKSILVILVLLVSFGMVSCSIKEYTVTINYNNTKNSETIIEKMNDTINDLEEPIKNGYYFIGWIDQDDIEFIPSKTIISKNYVIYAQWELHEIDKIYQVTFQPNNGDEDIIVSVFANDTIDNVIKPTKDGYTFLGWYLGESLFDNEMIINNDYVIIAKYKKIEVINTYLITYKYVDDVNYKVYDIEEGKLLYKEENPIREGYIFLGWYLNDSLFNFDTPIKTNIVLKAKWQKILYYKVILKYNDNVNKDIILEVEMNNKIDRPETIPNIEDKEFIGWYNGSSLFDFNSLINSDLIIEAKYSNIEVDSYTVLFDYDDIAIENVILNINKGEYINEPLTPIKEGYIFEGWTINDILFNFDTPIHEDIILIAKWQKIIKYKVIFKYNDNGTSDLEVIYNKGDVVSKPIETPKKEGYTFEGWQVNGINYDFNQLIQSDLIIVASYSKIPEIVYYDVTFNYDDNVVTKKVKEGNQVEVLELIPEKIGFIFENWVTLDGNIFNFKTSITSNITLYPKYKRSLDDKSRILFAVDYHLKTSNFKMIGTGTIITGEYGPQLLETVKSLKDNEYYQMTKKYGNDSGGMLPKEYVSYIGTSNNLLIE